MFKKISTAIALITMVSMPLYAQTGGYTINTSYPGSTAHPQTLADLVGYIIFYLNMALDLMMVFAIVMFVWNVIQYFVKPNAERKDAGLYVMYSIIGFFVILSIWGILNILGNSFGLGNQYNQTQSWSGFTSLFPK